MKMSDTTNPSQITGNAKIPSDTYGDSISNVYITGSDSIEVDAGGTATNISAAGGNGYVYGGTASNWTANSGGYIAVDSGATLNGLTLDGGYVEVNNGATINTADVSNTSNLDGKGYLIINDGTVNGGTVDSGGTIDAKGTNAIASGITASSGGKILAEQGTVDHATVESGARFEVALSGGPASATNTIINGGEFYVDANGSATTTTVASGGDMSAGGYVSGTTLNNGKLTVLDGGTASGTTVNGTSASLYVNSNASAYGNTIDGGSVFVDGIFSGGTLSNGGQIRVSKGGVISNINATDGSLWVSAGGSAYDTTIVSGFTQVDGYISGGSIYDGKIQIDSGATASGVFASGTDDGTQGTIEVDGGTVTDATTHDYGNVTLISGTVNNLSATGGGITMTGGTLSGGTFQSGATMTVSAGTVDGIININNNGHANVSGGKVSDINIASGGSGAITGGSVADVTVSSGGTVNFSSGATLTDTLTLSSGATASITGNTGGTVDLGDGYTSGLTITGLNTSTDTNVTTTINGWTKDSQIDLQYVTFDNAKWVYADKNTVAITTKDATTGDTYTVTLNIPNVEETGFNLVNDNQGGTTIVTCFLAGSMISTPNGDVVVEDIQIGDELVTFDWEHDKEVTRPVVWVGKAHAKVRADLPDDEAGYPVRIIKNAISDGVPYKDMLITAEHCLCFEGKFVPVRMLVNGFSIFYDKSITSYDYYHVETDQHSVITADGMLTESYLDTGNRRTFRQEGQVATLCGSVRNWEEDAGAPLCVDRACVEPLFHKLEARGNCVVGHNVPSKQTVLVADPNLHLVTQAGAVVRPVRQEGQRYSFMLPANTQSVRIVSRASRPADVIGPFVDDRRQMGVAVADVHFTTAKKLHPITAHLQAEKPEGWHDTDWTDCAWTNGNAVLPLGDFTKGNMGLLSLTVRAAGPYLLGESDKQARVLSA
ncbi:outer membrane protein [Acetobacter pasteurianus NBRC 3188]|uniref:Outer membrane protein n=2 Tax=Acetobacter pasteurianus TaxID=438 RepID=A0A401WQQ8_ACEPA|nr:outer membrane protein [Acetobacter pasteurianus NBRC 3188]